MPFQQGLESVRRAVGEWISRGQESRQLDEVAVYMARTVNSGTEILEDLPFEGY